MGRKSNNVSTIKSVSIEFMPDAEKAAQAQKQAVPGYRRALIKKMKQQAEEKKSLA